MGAAFSLHSRDVDIAELKNVTAVQAIAEGNSLFSAVLHDALREQNPNNLLVSPFCLSAVVAMTKLAAHGKTSTEIAKGLFLPTNKKISKGYSQVIESFQEPDDGYTFLEANRLYTQSGFEFKPEFVDVLQDSFGVEAQQLDFGNNVAAAEEINSWVESVTKSKIKDVIDAETLNNSTNVVLVNGVYFKGLWKYNFKLDSTRKAPFHLNDEETVEVDMMHKKAVFPHADIPELLAQAVALPYKGDRLVMIVYLSRAGEATGLSQIEEGLRLLTPSKILESMESSLEINVHLPRFKIESSHSLVEPLKKLGVETVFSQNSADLSGIPESSVSLFVSEIVQKVLIEVDEEGDAVAAVDAFLCQQYPISFNVNRPFVFQIVDTYTNIVLLHGTCKNPTQTYSKEETK